MSRLALIALVAACSSGTKSPEKPASIDDRAVRIRVAYAEARRGGGLAELTELAAHGAKHERVLALRGLGRVGGATAVAALKTALGDPDRDVIAAAAAGLGLTASLDDDDLKITPALLDALARSQDHVAVIEALGRAGDASAQPTLVAKLAGPTAVAEQAAIALGRHGRRKIALSDEARDTLVKATTHADVAVRYAATWALGREHQPKDAPGVVPALIARIADDNAEVRAQAVAALAKRKQVAAAAKEIEQALVDKDWRVQIEAMRALSNDEHRAAVTAAIARGTLPLVASEGLHAFLGKPFDAAAVTLDGPVGDTYRAIAENRLIQLLPRLQSHLALAIVADWVKAKGGNVADRRSAMATMLADNDVRVRAAAIGVLPSTWADGDDKDHDAIVKTIAGAIASKDPILSGSAIDASDELLDTLKDDKFASQREELNAALAYRADGETDVELAASLFGVIEKHAIGNGLAACQKGLTGHPVVFAAASACVKKLGGQTPSRPDPIEAKPPFVDITQVIGRRVIWHVTTTKGELDIELRPDVAPWAVATIVTLTKRGFYDGIEFHRVVPDFVVQGGDPTESGWGGPGFLIPAEPASMLDGPGFIAGGVGIADAGRDSGGSQWFVMHSRATHLDGRYTWVGSVVGLGNPANVLQIGDEVTKATVEITAR